MAACSRAAAPFVTWADHHEVELPPGHRFPMAKYAAVRHRLQSEGRLHAARGEPAEPGIFPALLALHDPGYVQAFCEGAMDVRAFRRIGFPWSPSLVHRTLASTRGTWRATQEAVAGCKVAMNLAGGTHHAFVDRGEGFCVFNDLAVAALWAVREGGVRQALIIDLDVHQGNGTAACVQDCPEIFTFSMHGARNFPFRKEVSDLDIALPDNADDAAWLEALDLWLPRLMHALTPDLIFFQAGVDALAVDSLGRTAMTHAGLRARNERVLAHASMMGAPLVITMGGGYSRPIGASVEAHADVYRQALAYPWS